MIRRAVVVACAALLLAAPLHARSLAIRGFDVEIIVRRDGTVHVTERITVYFQGEWNGLYRTIPISYDWSGFNYSLLLDLERATDENGNALEVESERADGRRKFKIWVPNAHDATHVVTLEYTVRNALRFFDEHDELFWNVTGTDWDVPVGNASATVVLPPNVTNVRASAFTGGYGATEQNAAIEQVANSVAVRTTAPLDFREGLTVVVGWDPGVVHRPTQAQIALAFFLANSVLLIPFFAGLGMWRWWRRHGRDPAALSIVPQYEPPEGLTPGELGVLLDNSADMRDVTATLVHLAVRGYLTITEEEKSSLLGLVKSRDYIFESTQPPASWLELKPHERALLEGLFDQGKRKLMLLSELENSFYKELPAIKTSLIDSLVDRGFCTRRPDSIIARYVTFALFAGGIVGIGSAIWLEQLGAGTLPGVVAGILTAVVLGAFGLLMPARTVRGARVRENALGFSEFLERVEKDRFDRVIKTPAMFEAFLPYAMAFGVENNWARAFDGIYREPPSWYHGPRRDGFMVRGFVGDLSTMATRTSTAMASAPRSSSSSSGFGGGGFSGGGFGGGGGGGF